MDSCGNMLLIHCLWFGNLWEYCLSIIFEIRCGKKIYLKKEHDIQSLLSGVSGRLTQQRDIERIKDNILGAILQGEFIDYVAMYLLDDEDAYRIQKLENRQSDCPTQLSKDMESVKYLKKYGGHILYDELKMRNERTEGLGDIHKVTEDMEMLKAQVIFAIRVEDNLLGFLVLGERTDKGIYTKELLSSFDVLCNQAGLAVENAIFHQERCGRIKQEEAQSRRESLDMLVSTMAHEIDNPVSVAVFNLYDARNGLEDCRESKSLDQSGEIEKSLDIVEEALFRVSSIIKAVETYSRGGSKELQKISIYDSLKHYKVLFGMVRKKHKDVEYTESIEEGLPEIMGDHVLVEEILMNFSANAFHAVKSNDYKKEQGIIQRVKEGRAYSSKEDTVDASQKVSLRVFKTKDNFVRIEFKDNGYGIKDKVKEHIFEVPSTTKGSLEGTGLGLYRVRQICEILSARYGAESFGDWKGAMFYVEIPVARDVSEVSQEGV